MAFFNQLPKSEIKKRFNFVILWMLLPVYAKLEYVEEFESYTMEYGRSEVFLPDMQELNWIPRPLFWIFSAVAGAYLFFTAALGSPHIPVVLLYELEEEHPNET